MCMDMYTIKYLIATVNDDIYFCRKPCSYLGKVQWQSIPDGNLIYRYSQIALVSNIKQSIDQVSATWSRSIFVPQSVLRTVSLVKQAKGRGTQHLMYRNRKYFS